VTRSPAMATAFGSALRARGCVRGLQHGSQHARAFSAVGAPSLQQGVRLLVCDMAGTTVEENGLVYTTLRDSMCRAGLSVSEADMHPWHGASKEEVVRHFVRREEAPRLAGRFWPRGVPTQAAEDLERAIVSSFEADLRDAYLAPGSPLSLVDPSLPDFFEKLRARGVKVGLNTGYPRALQSAIIEKLGLDEMVDGYVCAQDVAAGRPSPLMVRRLMEMLGVEDARAVAKAGDTERDIAEAINAGCSQAIGVLSGADSREVLEVAGATDVVDNVTQMQLAA